MAGTESARILSIIVRGSSFEDAKRKMEAALQANIESVLRQHSRAVERRLPDNRTWQGAS